jgi:hypothetical protein
VTLGFIFIYGLPAATHRGRPSELSLQNGFHLEASHHLHLLLKIWNYASELFHAAFNHKDMQ